MKIVLTEDEMLALWRQARGLDTGNVYNAVTDRIDGIDVDALLVQQMRGWYADLLLHAPEQLLVCTDLSVALDAAGDYCWEATLPVTVVRVFDVHVAGVPLSIPIITEGVVNPFMSPVGILKGNRLVIAPFEDKPQLPRVRVVTRPTDNTYVFDDCVLKQIFPYTPKEL